MKADGGGTEGWHPGAAACGRETGACARFGEEHGQRGIGYRHRTRI